MILKKAEKLIWVLALAVSAAFPVLLRAESTYTPTPYGGNFGLGLELGDPYGWGVSAKIWADQRNAFQPAVKAGFDSAILQLDYLWHDFDLIHVRAKDGEMPFYIGVGGDLTLQSPADLGVRAPVGVSYIFEKKNVPLDIYLQVVPTLWFYGDGGSLLRFYGEFGSRYYFKA